jgi:hypothetical protein
LIGNRFCLQGQCDLDLWPLDPKINRGHLLVMTNHHTKFEVPRPKGSLVITRKPFGLRTDGPTDRQVQSNIPPFLRNGGIITKEIFSLSAHEFTASFTTVKWHHSKTAIHSRWRTEMTSFYTGSVRHVFEQRCAQ